MKTTLLNLFKLLFLSILMLNFNNIILNINSNNKDSKLVKIYDHVCNKIKEDRQYECECFSKNNDPKLTDQEIITIYNELSRNYPGIIKMNKIHQFESEYLLSWFPDLGSYQTFNQRINKLSNVINTSVGMLLNEFTTKEC